MYLSQKYDGSSNKKIANKSLSFSFRVIYASYVVIDNLNQLN